MSDPRRLLLEGTPVQRSLLSAAEADAPTSDAERAARVALGLAVPLVPLPTPEPLTSAAATTAGLSAGTKAGLALVTAVSVVGAGLGVARITDRRVDVPPPPAKVRTAPVRPAPPPPIRTLPPILVQVPEPPRPASKPKRPRPPKAPGLSRALLLLDRCRVELEEGAVGAAASTLSRYRQEIGAGPLEQEARALEMEIAFAQRSTEADSIAQAFLQDFPGSPHAARARGLLDGRAAP